MPEETSAQGPIGTIGRYLIRGELGRGGMGIVYRADDPRLGRDVAIKVIRTDLFESRPEIEELARRFEGEARAAARLHHPGIVAIFDLGADADQKYIVMEFVEGTNLRDLIGLRGISLTQALEVLHQVATALDYAHSLNVIHRDVKPANIMVAANLVAKVMDFGIAKFDLSSSTVTPNGHVVGTSYYMSPEHIRGLRHSPGFDVWSLAVTAFELLAGKRPFSGPDRLALERFVLQGYPEGATYRGNFPVSVDRIFQRALARLPEDRYRSCREFLLALAEACHSGIAPGPPAPRPSAIQEADRRYQAGDFAGAFRSYLAAAEGGDSRAMYNLGVLCEDGAGVRRDPSLARQWYLKAAEANVAEAMNRLGLLYERGDGVPPDATEAVRWYQRAAAAGNKMAAGNLARLRSR
jgi:serine/threonine protein kinase